MKSFKVNDRVKCVRTGGFANIKFYDNGIINEINDDYTIIKMSNDDEVIINNELVGNFFIKMKGEMKL